MKIFKIANFTGLPLFFRFFVLVELLVEVLHCLKISQKILIFQLFFFELCVFGVRKCFKIKYL